MKAKSLGGLVVGVVLILAGGALLAVTRDPGPALLTRDLDNTARTFDASVLLAASDADMVGTTYADGELKPMAGATDLLNSVDPNSGSIQSIPAPNSVAAWPGTLDVSPDGRLAYIVESQGAAPPGILQIKNVHADMLPGHRLTTLDLSSDAPTAVRQDDVGTNPVSVHTAPNGRWLVVATRDDTTPLTFVVLDHGIPFDHGLRRPSLTVPGVPRPATDKGLTYARLSPDGRRVAVHIASTHVLFGDIVFDSEDLPVDVRFGTPLLAGKYISIGRWSVDGRHYIVADTDWGPDPGESLRAGPGRLISMAVDGRGGRVVSSATVSFGSEGFDVNREGDLFVVVNMERTYAPEHLPFSLIPRRHQASLSLVAFDRTKGTLRTVDGPLGFEGVLPEDAVFDRDGDMVAVAVFHDRQDAPDAGWIELFAVDRASGDPRLARTGKRLRTPRGVHDLAVVY